MKRLLFGLIIAIICSACQTKQDPINFTILQMNDVYEIAALENGKVGGMSRVAGVLRALENENKNTLCILSGDFLSPSLLGTLEYDKEKIAGKQMIETMNATGVDYVAFGNHEFDLKEHQLLARINESEFNWISTNAFHKTDQGVAPFIHNGKPISREMIHLIKTDKATLKLGLIGVVLPFNQKKYVAYEDVIGTVRESYNKLSKTCDIVLAITHLEVDDDKKLAEAMPEIPLLMGGHDHKNMNVVLDHNSITKADANAKTVYVHRFQYDPESKKTSIQSELIPIDESSPEDEAVAKIVEKWVAIGDTSMYKMGYKPNDVVTHTDEPWDGRESVIRYQQSLLGEVIANSMLAAFPEAEGALFNSGSIRVDDILNGDILQYDILRTLPFGGSIAITDMKGNELIKTLETGTVKNMGIGGYLQIKNFEKRGDDWYINNNKINAKHSYKVLLTDFLMKGKEANLGFLKDIPSEIPAKVFGDDNDIRKLIIHYFAAQ